MQKNMVQAQVYGVDLPAINTVTCAMTLGWGVTFRHVALTSLIHGAQAAFGSWIRRDNTSTERNVKHAKRYMISMCAEVGVSVVIAPMRYLAAVTTQRLLFDYTSHSLSDALSVMDRFDAGKFMAFALHAFASDSEWNLDFFIWQIPSVVLTVGKLIARRRNIGAQKCRTFRVLGVLGCQMFLRALLSSFCVQLPQTEGDATVALIMVTLESLCTNYLVRHTWPLDE